MTHYFPKDDDGTLKLAAESHSFTGPVFVGQGLTRGVGSDAYGFYIVSIEKAKNGKPIIGIVSAASEFITSWTDGSEVCSLPNGATDPAKCKADQWITTYGKYKETGAPKWWYCDKNGNRKNPSGWHRGKAHFGWNGASAYRDPSF